MELRRELEDILHSLFLVSALCTSVADTAVGGSPGENSNRIEAVASAAHDQVESVITRLSAVISR